MYAISGDALAIVVGVLRGSYDVQNYCFLFSWSVSDTKKGGLT